MDRRLNWSSIVNSNQDFWVGFLVFFVFVTLVVWIFFFTLAKVLMGSSFRFRYVFYYYDRKKKEIRFSYWRLSVFLALFSCFFLFLLRDFKTAYDIAVFVKLENTKFLGEQIGALVYEDIQIDEVNIHKIDREYTDYYRALRSIFPEHWADFIYDTFKFEVIYKCYIQYYFVKFMKVIKGVGSGSDLDSEIGEDERDDDRT